MTFPKALKMWEPVLKLTASSFGQHFLKQAAHFPAADNFFWHLYGIQGTCLSSSSTEVDS